MLRSIALANCASFCSLDLLIIGDSAFRDVMEVVELGGSLGVDVISLGAGFEAGGQRFVGKMGLEQVGD